MSPRTFSTACSAFTGISAPARGLISDARIKQAARKFFETHSMTTERGEFKLAGGRVGMEMAVNDEMT